MAVADNQLHAAQTPAVQAAQELGPERLRFAGTDLDAQDFALALGVDANRHYHRHAHDSSGFSCLDVGRVDPQVRPVAFDGPIQERPDALVKLRAQPADLALGYAGHSK